VLEFFYGGSVRKKDGMFEDMEEELEWFDGPPSFNDLCVRLNAKFGGDFTLKGRFDSGKCNTPGVYHQLSSGFELKHGRLSGDEDVKVKPMEMSPNLNLDIAPLLYI
jgi:hypothetical protein